MKKIKKALSIMLVVVIMLTATPLSGFMGLEFPEGLDFSMEVSAAETNDDSSAPISVTVTTDSSSYGAMEYANITVEIINNGTKTVDNVSAIGNFDSLVPIGNELSLYVDGESIEPGGALYYGYKVSIQPSRLNFLLNMFLSIKNFFSGKCSVPNVNFNDGRETSSDTIEISFGGKTVSETVTVWYERPIDIIETESDIEYNEEIIRLINEQMSSSSFDEKLALEDKYYTQRIIIEGDNLNNINFDDFSLNTVIFNDSNSQAVIQCNSEEAARYCEIELNKLNNVDVVDVDVIMQTYVSSSLTWGKSFIKADSYEHYLENNNYFDMITVAVVDTGVDSEHSYLKNRITSNGFDFVNRDNIADDEHGHGTHVAGIIASCTEGLNVKILPIKVLNKDGIGSSYVIAQGIRQAANDGAEVINLSLGGEKNKIIDSAVDYAINAKGSVVCVAAGNDKINTENVSPASSTDAIVVAAIDKDGNIASFSNYGSSVDVAAPGVDVFSTYLEGSYAKLSGTSMAAPHISAIAAMFKIAYPEYAPNEIETLIKEYCRDLGAVGRDDIYGSGTVNMYNAIPDCTIKFDTNGGSYSADQTVKSTENISLPTPTKTYTIRLDANGGTVDKSTYTAECTLEGWYKSSSLTGVRYDPNDLYMTHYDETLYAKWSNPKNIVLDNPTRQNYKFTGWWTSPNGGTMYSSSQEITSNITLYAQWEQMTNQILDYTNWDVNEAIANLTSNGMNYTLSYSYNINYSSGKVIGQSVAGNSVIPLGTTITLYVSSGAKPIESGDWVVFNGGTYLYRTLAGGPQNGVYKQDASGGTITGVYNYNGTVYYQFQYYGASEPFGWAPAWAFTQQSN